MESTALKQGSVDRVKLLSLFSDMRINLSMAKKQVKGQDLFGQDAKKKFKKMAKGGQPVNVTETAFAELTGSVAPSLRKRCTAYMIDTKSQRLVEEQLGRLGR